MRWRSVLSGEGNLRDVLHEDKRRRSTQLTIRFNGYIRGSGSELLGENRVDFMDWLPRVSILPLDD